MLELTRDDLIEKFASGVSMVTDCLLPSHAQLLLLYHTFPLNAYKNVLSLTVATEYSFPQADKVKDYLAGPSKFAVASGPVAAVSSTAPTVVVVEEVRTRTFSYVRRERGE